MKYFVLILVSTLIFSCNSSEKDTSNEVFYSGAMKNIMAGDISAKIDLITLKDKKHLYALGAIENLKGEIQIFDSESYNTSVHKNSLKYDKSLTENATLLVYAEVPEWVAFKIPKEIVSYKEFEDFVEKTASENKVDINKPFPFLLEGVATKFSWHVINWRDNDTNHSHDKHKTSGLYGMMMDRYVDMLGFYSNNHQGIFTHHTTNMHIHVKTEGNGVSGHIDDLDLGEGMILKLPKILN